MTEVTIGTLSLAVSQRTILLAAAALYFAFALYLSARLIFRVTGGCGCGGVGDIPPTWLHTMLNVAAAAAFLVGIGGDMPSLLQVMAEITYASPAYLAAIAGIALAVHSVVTLLRPLFRVPTEGIDLEWLASTHPTIHPGRSA